MKFKYFVSYADENGYGMCEVSTAKKIETYEDVVSMMECINKEFGRKVISMSF